MVYMIASMYIYNFWSVEPMNVNGIYNALLALFPFASLLVLIMCGAHEKLLMIYYSCKVNLVN